MHLRFYNIWGCVIYILISYIVPVITILQPFGQAVFFVTGLRSNAINQHLALQPVERRVEWAKAKAKLILVKHWTGPQRNRLLGYNHFHFPKYYSYPLIAQNVNLQVWLDQVFSKLVTYFWTKKFCNSIRKRQLCLFKSNHKCCHWTHIPGWFSKFDIMAVMSCLLGRSATKKRENVGIYPKSGTPPPSLGTTSLWGKKIWFILGP